MEGEVRVDRSPTHCPYCKGPLEDLNKVVACAACGARHHDACRAEHGRCATCASTDVLVPPGRGHERLEPVRGTAIRMREDGGALHLSWSAGAPPAQLAPVLGAVAVALAVVALRSGSFAPLAGAAVAGVAAAAILVERWRAPRTLEVVLDPDGIEFLGGPPVGPSRPVRAAWADVGAVRAERLQAGYGLTIDVGLERHQVKLSASFASSTLSEPEVDWLARVVESWRGDV